jgi:hypothetical protein
MGSIVTDNSGQVIGLLNSAFGSYGGPNISAGSAMIEDVTSALDCFIFDERQELWTRSASIGGTGLVFVITRPNVEATLSIRYLSGRIRAPRD